MRVALAVLLSIIVGAGCAHYRVVNHLMNKPLSHAYERLSLVIEKIGNGPHTAQESQELIEVAKDAQDTPQGILATVILLREYQATNSPAEYSQALERGLANLYGTDLFVFLGIAGQQGQELLNDSLLSESAKSALFVCMNNANESFFAASPSLGFWIDAYSETFGFPRLSCGR